MERQAVKSSNIASIGYDEANSILEVQFLNGKVFQYAGVPKELHENFMKSESKGKFFYANIRKADFVCKPIVEVKDEKKERDLAVGTEETGASEQV